MKQKLKKKKRVNKKIVLISCCKSKLPSIARVKDLYISKLFRYSLKYARSLKPNKIFVLSAKHGLLDLESRKYPYNVTLSYVTPKKREHNLKVLTKEEKQTWGKKVIKQLSKKANLKNDKFIILAGKAYLNPIRKGLTNIEEPLEGLNQGKSIKWLKEKVGPI